MSYPASFTTRPTLRGTFGMTSSTHWLASQSAMAELEAGGNAFDAAVAGAFVLHVVEPHLNGPGGEVPAVFATAGDPTPTVLCGQGPAPAGATREHYRRLGLDLVPGSGPLAAAVPGAVDAWLMLAADHGTRSLRDLLGYAEGVRPVRPPAPATRRPHGRQDGADVPRPVADLGGPLASARTSSAGLGGRRQPGLRRRARPPGRRRGRPAGADRTSQFEAARRAWREGCVAVAGVAVQRRPFRDSSGADHAGLVTAGDMAAWTASYEPAAVHRFRDVEVAKTGTWGQGPVLLQALAMLEGMPAAALDPSTVAGVHAIAEVLKLAFADREAWYGDHSPVDLGELLDPSYVVERRALVGERASAELRPGSPGGRTPMLPEQVERAAGLASGAGLGEPTVSWNGETRGDTCHLDVVDRWGNFISATPSGGWLQSSPTVPELGFCLGSRMQMFWLDEGLPSSLAPGRRPRTTLSPTLVLRDGRPVLACGTPGGDQQDQWQLPFLLRHLVGGLDLQEAIDAPTFHTTSFPSSFFPREMVPGELVVEDRLGDDVLAELTRRGHRVTRSGPWSLGRLSAVARDPDTGLLSAAANPRGAQGYAVGR